MLRKRTSLFLAISLVVLLSFGFASAAWYSPFTEFFDNLVGGENSKITGSAIDDLDASVPMGDSTIPYDDIYLSEGAAESTNEDDLFDDGSSVIEISSCQVLDIKDATYVLNRSLNGAEVTDKCFEIQASGAKLDCQGNSIINHDLKGTVIHISAWRSVVENCHVEAYLGESMGYEDSIGIFSAWSNRAIIRNNLVKHVGSGIYVYSENNLIEGNTVENTIKGIRVRKSGNVISNNVVSNNVVGQGWGFEAWKAPGAVFSNNSAYGNEYGLIIKQSSGTNVSCSEFLNNGIDIYLYDDTSISSNEDIGFWGVKYGSIRQEEGQVTVYSEECEEEVVCVGGCEIGQDCIDGVCRGLIGHWKLDEDATDSIGDNDGTSMGDVDLNAVDRHRGNVAVFDGAGDYINMGEPLTLSPHERKEWTITAWVNPSEAKEMYIINKGWEYYSISSESDRIRAHFYSWNGTRFLGKDVLSNAPLPINEWTFVALSVNYNEGVARLYSNEVVSEITLNKSESMYETDQVGQFVYIGAYQYHDYGGGTYAPGSFFSGSIDDVMIYDYALGIDEVNDLYNEGLAVCPNSKCSGCVNDGDCNDGIACTNDVCSSDHSCENIAMDNICDDGNICTDDVCIGANGDSLGCSVSFNVNSCDDLIDCTENDICSEGSCSGVPNDDLCESYESCFSDVGCDQSDCSSCEDCDGWFFDECYYDECHNSCNLGSSCYFKGVIFGNNCVGLESVCGSSVLECEDYSEEECENNPCGVGSGCILDEGNCVDASLDIEISLSILADEYYLGDPIRLSYVFEEGESREVKSLSKDTVFDSFDKVRTGVVDLDMSHVDGELLIMLKDGVEIESLEKLNIKYDVDEILNDEFGYLNGFYKLKLDEDDLVDALEEYKARNEVVYAGLNYYAEGAAVPSDTKYADQWAHQKTDAEDGWDIEIGDSDIVIAIIDTGVDYTHEDLVGNMLGDCSEGCPYGTGIDYVHTANVNCDDEDCTDPETDPMDYHGHGTAAAGIAVASSNNNLGIAGVCQNCTIMPIRAGFAGVSGNALFEYANLYNAIYYASIMDDVDIISISFSGPDDPFLQRMIDIAYDNGKIVIAAVGNSHDDTPSYPAAYDNVIAVASTDEVDSRSDFSNYGSWVDVAAPGTNMMSTVPLSGVYSDATGYMNIEGTSISSAYVSGLAGLLLSKNSNLVQDEILSILKQSSDDITTDEYIGGGRVNVNNALSLSLQSRIVNNLDSDISGKLTMTLQRKVGESWVDEAVGFDELEIVIPSGGLVQLTDGLDDGGSSAFSGWNSLNVVPTSTGDYRVYAFFDFDGQIAETNWEFEVIPTCLDDSKNQDETDVDCGGDVCDGCELGLACLIDGDCLSHNCDLGFCGSPKPFDVTMSVATQKNFYEIGGTALLN